jgi:putative nucleotidyltransferase with HDIG domain
VDKVLMMINARKLLKDISDLPTIPVIVSKVIALLDNPEADPADIADLILSDQVLAARVIRVVNSPLYRSTGQITSVKRALLHIGFKNIREMILTNYFIDGFKGKKQSFDMNMFWMHSFSVGVISRHIATLIGYKDFEKAYLVGIIHDIGKVLLGHYCKEDYSHMLNTISNTSCTTYEAEYNLFQTTHSEVGFCLAQRWNFPSSFCDVISNHHTSGLATEDTILTAIVSLADFFCLSHIDAKSLAQASIPGLSEENAWHILKQFSDGPLNSSLEHFISNLSEKKDELLLDVAQLFNTMVTTDEPD